jgi:hypothetical protein
MKWDYRSRLWTLDHAVVSTECYREKLPRSPYVHPDAFHPCQLHETLASRFHSPSLDPHVCKSGTIMDSELSAFK